MFFYFVILAKFKMNKLFISHFNRALKSSDGTEKSEPNETELSI
jgi:hypothetical protein